VDHGGGHLDECGSCDGSGVLWSEAPVVGYRAPDLCPRFEPPYWIEAERRASCRSKGAACNATPDPQAPAPLTLADVTRELRAIVGGDSWAELAAACSEASSRLDAVRGLLTQLETS
jgi:hypothetical protein